MQRKQHVFSSQLQVNQHFTYRKWHYSLFSNPTTNSRQPGLVELTQL